MKNCFAHYSYEACLSVVNITCAAGLLGTRKAWHYPIHIMEVTEKHSNRKKSNMYVVVTKGLGNENN